MPPEIGSTTRADSFLEALRAASRTIGVVADDPQLLRLHGSGIFLLSGESVVARVIEATEENRARAITALRVTGWLAQQGFPGVRPVHEAVVEAAGSAVSFWHYLPQPEGAAPPSVAVSGSLLRELHALPRPPFTLPTVDPLARLRRAAEQDSARSEPVLSVEQHTFIEERMASLAGTYAQLDFPLGIGLIHNDAHPGNLLVDDHSPYDYVLADWDGACLGPREIDLVQEGAPGNRFGETEEQRQAFSTAYGYDLASWPSWRILRDLRDLHSLAAYIRTAPTKPAARAELQLRLETLQVGDRTRRWRAVA